MFSFDCSIYVSTSGKIGGGELSEISRFDRGSFFLFRLSLFLCLIIVIFHSNFSHVQNSLAKLLVVVG